MRNAIVLLFSAMAFMACNAESGDDSDKLDSNEENVDVSSLDLVFNARNYLKNLATGYCLDSNAQGRVYTNSCYWATYQEWYVTQGTYGARLRDTATNRCLDSNTSGSVYTLPCNGGAFQEWTAVWTPDGYQTLKNVATGRYLDSNTSREVYTLPPNGGSFQKWINYYRP